MEPQETQVTQKPSFSFSEKLQILKNKYISKKTVGVVIALLIAVNIPVALYLNQQRQNAKQHASTNGAVSILDATTNQQITETTTPDIKLQILLPDNWDLPTPSVSPTPISKFNIIQQTYAQTTTPTDTPIASTVTPSVLPTTITTPTQTPIPTTEPTVIPTNLIPTTTITPTANPNLPPTISSIGPHGNDGSLIIYFGSYTTATGGHKIYRCLGNNCNPTNQITPIETIPNGQNYYIDLGASLTCNTNYSYTIKAVYLTGDSAFSNTMSTKTAACPTGSITPSGIILPSPTGIARHTLQSIIIANAESGDGNTSRIITGQDLITALASSIAWKLNSLTNTETTAQRKVTIQFVDTNGESVATFSEITLQNPNLQASPTATPSTTIDILDYFITKHPDKGLTGTHPISQVVDGQRAYYMKWQRAGDPTGKSSIFEVYTWDNDNIYLKEDHSGAPVNFYTFAPGTWMKRHMTVGEKVTVNSNTIQWYDPTCNAVAPNNQQFPIEMTLERKDPQYDLGNDLGKQDVIVLKYDSAPTSTTGIFERFYYSKEWGWVKWEEYNKATNTVNNTSTFNKISQTPPLQPHLPAACTPEFRTPNTSPSATLTPNPIASPSATPTATPSGTISIIPTMTLMPTPTIIPGNTAFTIKVGLQGIGNGANTTPVHSQRTFSIMLFDSNGMGIGSTAPNAILTFNPATNLFEGHADMGKPAPGNYTVKAKTDKYLTKVLSNILTVTAGTTSYTFPTIPTLVAGDLNNDNLLNIEDFNMYKECLGKNSDDCVTKVDLNNDGETDTILPSPKFLDYRLLIGNFSLQKGE